MIHFEPIPLLEAHFFLASQQTGFSVSNFFTYKDPVDISRVREMNDYIRILSELEARLTTSIRVTPEELQSLFGDLGDKSDYPDDPGASDTHSTFYIANLVSDSISLYRSPDCFDYLRNQIGDVRRKIATRILGEEPSNLSDAAIVDIIMVSSLSNDAKLLLIDLAFHPLKYVDMLERALRPAADEFLRCTDLVAPLLDHFRAAFADIQTHDDETRFLERIVKHNLPAGKGYDIFPLVCYFHRCIFSISEPENAPIGIACGVLYDIIRLCYRDISDVGSKLVNIMSAMASKNRFDILAKLSEGRFYGKELSEYLGLSPATISHHINALLSAGLVNLDAGGKRVYYSINYDGTEAFLQMLHSVLDRK